MLSIPDVVKKNELNDIELCPKNMGRVILKDYGTYGIVIFREIGHLNG